MIAKHNYIENFVKVHGDRYDYSNSKYKDSKTKIEIICKKHGAFFQIPIIHYNGHGCPLCGRKLTGEKSAITQSSNSEEFIKKAMIVHGNKYNYSQVDYKNNTTKVEILCMDHGSFYQTPAAHLKKQLCPKCGNIKKGLSKRYDREKLIEKFRKVHGEKYDYGESEIKTVKDKIKIICREHGDFFQNPDNHMFGKGCPKCAKKKSKGEVEMRKLFSVNNVNFIEQFSFPHCRDKGLLFFDFAVFKNNDLVCLIEIDGVQHRKSVEFFGGEKYLVETINRDNIKNVFCLNNKIKLIRMKYDHRNMIEFKIKLEEILTFLKKLK